ncbi:uncharacterized protein LOC126716155 [Quercus robur]|uniref:uncharacterized protein LOC126716155 n=1 Tax=Quercus robur TaxID=38942 RepID=UPI002162CCA4|nr:uncharacterized protein LOC126716155 [Quercus robur]
MSGARADEIIETLPFDGYAVADTIGFAGGIWMLWRSDLVQVDVLAATEQEIHALIRALMGDFNEVLSADEKYGGNPIFQRRVRAIKECMDDYSMMDLGFSGPKPFRFQTIWLSYSEFPVVVRDAWASREGNLAEAISNFKTKAQRWNKEVFGNVFLRKKKNLARLLGAQRALAVCPNSFLINLQKQLIEEYNLILQIEEELWAMKSRTNWIISGERNTSYFHISALNRRSKNRITCVQNNEGEWCHSLEEVKEIFNSSFKKLYKSEQVFCPVTPQWRSNWCAKLSQEEAGSMTNIPSDGEIWNALKSMKPYKAPSVDGLHVGFFQRFWLVVGDSVKREIKEVFLRQKVLKFLNQTLVALIPKQPGPETVSQYRPISLCNTIYKIISKIIVLRLCPLLPSLISPMQTTFLEGRRGTDNVIIAQELIYSLRKRKGRMGFMVIKIDLEKAYDRLEWSFIKMVLQHFGFLESMIKLIMSCVSTTTTTALLFNGNRKNCEAIIEVLDNFCNLAGQKVNLTKSKILFSPNVSCRRRRGICRRLGIAKTTNLGKYLGFPIIHQGRVGNVYNFVVNKIQSKQAGWRSKLLSNVGRLVLVKATAAPVAEYYMQCQSLPAKVCDQVDKLIRYFLWGSTEEKRRLHLVGWDKVTLPKELGGLGLHKMKDRNIALLAKLCWRLAYEKEAPWAKMIVAKYLSPSRMIEEGKKLPCSSCWAACKKGGPVYVKGLKWSVKNGETVKVWTDFWLPMGALRSLIEGPLNRDEDFITVKQCFDHNYEWQSHCLSFELPDHILNAIKATPLSCNQEAKDSLQWAFSKNGFFSLKSAYLLARGLNPLNLDTVLVAWVWKVEAFPKIQFFLWLCLHNSVPTREVLDSRGLSLDPICSLCHQSIETIDHLLRGCEYARDFWQQLQFLNCMRETFNLPISEWLEASWKVDRSCFKKSIKDSVEFFSIGLHAKLPKAKSVIAVGWEKPPMGWAKLNSDRSAFGNTGRAGGGSVIRDHDGHWLKGYARPLGCTNSCMAELWALRDGLLIAKEMGINNLIIELDALSVVLLMNNNTANLLMKPLLTDCKNLVREISNKQIVHIYREANQCADALAKLGASSLDSFVIFLYPPPMVENILAFDKACLRCNRLIIS